MIAKKHFLPATRWLSGYSRVSLASDLTAAMVVTVLLIPQSLAYAMLAGLPPVVGLHASVLPLAVYALFGTSSTLSVGPVAVVSMMTAAVLGEINRLGLADPLTAAVNLALLSGLMLMVMGYLRLGFIVNFLSHPVISGFISASAILISISQLKHILGVSAHGDTLVELTLSLAGAIDQVNYATLVVGAGVLALLYAARNYAAPVLLSLGLRSDLAHLVAKTAPIFAVLLTLVAAYGLGLDDKGVALVGEIPSGLPRLALPLPSFALLQHLIVPALLISIIGYVESISVGKTLAGKRGERVDANQELVGLGAANLASALSGALPVTGGFSRTIVNFDAGAVTQAASIFAALGIALASIFLTPLLYYLPKATLAATIIVAVISLVDFGIIKKIWRFSKGDFTAVATTALVTLLSGVETGVTCGVLTSLALYLYRTAQPHIAEVGLVEGTEHFRNVRRYQVLTRAEILMLRLDENLFFANVHSLDETVREAIFKRGRVSDVILQCSAINAVDFSAYEELAKLNQWLLGQGVRLHLAEVKGPVADRLEPTGLIEALGGEIYLTQFAAFSSVCKRLDGGKL